MSVKEPRVGFLHSLIRKDEKLLLQAFSKANVLPVMLDDRELVLMREEDVLAVIE